MWGGHSCPPTLSTRGISNPPRPLLLLLLLPLLPPWTLRETFLLILVADVLSRRLRHHHLIRLLDEILQLIPTQRIQPIQHHPLVAPDIRRGTNVLALYQFGENLRRALETEPRIVQPEDGKNLSTDFETKIIAPLQAFFGQRKRQAKFANRVDIHLLQF
jgi:hypothetical protein